MHAEDHAIFSEAGKQRIFGQTPQVMQNQLVLVENPVRDTLQAGVRHRFMLIPHLRTVVPMVDQGLWLVVLKNAKAKSRHFAER
ncbi:hypothetical protein [Paraburkholderia megapolitana]|uniref:hypothetical protein n=1 Tax=Paraburkholderia megapolitana TaxID=420953 RepID=UPI0038BA7ADF